MFIVGNGVDYVSVHSELLTFSSGLIFGNVVCYNLIIVDDDYFEIPEELKVILSSYEPAFTTSEAAIVIQPDINDGW